MLKDSSDEYWSRCKNFEYDSLVSQAGSLPFSTMKNQSLAAQLSDSSTQNSSIIQADDIGTQNSKECQKTPKSWRNDNIIVLDIQKMQ